jgi:hypothetical protein
MSEQNQKHHQRAYALAKKAGCTPRWYDGILGWAWHCNCPSERTYLPGQIMVPAKGNEDHFLDQQCSVVKWYKTKKARIATAMC